MDTKSVDQFFKLLNQYCIEELDQSNNWKLKTDHGDVFVEISRHDGNHTAWEELTFEHPKPVRYFYVTYTIGLGSTQITGDMVISRQNLDVGEIKGEAVKLANLEPKFKRKVFLNILELNKEDFDLNFKAFGELNSETNSEDTE